jgi:hypothetical protein
LLTVREPPDESSVMRVRVPLAKPRICGATCLSVLPAHSTCCVVFGPNRVRHLHW